MRTVGVDFAAQPKNTAFCVLDWSNKRAEIVKLSCNVTDADIHEQLEGAEKAGFDVPLGWPRAFVASVQAYSERQAWPAFSTRELCFRATDHFIYAKDQSFCRAGSEKIVEVYPAAALRVWGFDADGYKRKEGAEKRRALFEDILTRTSNWLYLREENASLCRDCDDALDALIAALIARASACGLSEPIPEGMMSAAKQEGWIALPLQGSLEILPTCELHSCRADVP